MRTTSRLLVVAGLVLLAAAWIVHEPIPEGPVLVMISERQAHGITISDIPAVAVLVWAAWLTFRTFRPAAPDRPQVSALPSRGRRKRASTRP